MKFTIFQKKFSEGLSIALRFTTSKAQLPVLGNICLNVKEGKLFLSSTNLEMSVLLSTVVKDSVDGSITVPAKLLYEVVSNLGSDTVEVESEKEQMLIKSGNFSSRLSGMNASDFPAVPESVSKESLNINSKTLTSTLPKILFSVSLDETRPTLTGVLIEISKDNITFVATDGFRLSKKILPQKTGNEVKMILPKGIVMELGKLAKGENILLDLKKEDSQVVFQTDSIFLSSRVIEGDFPDYEKIIPKSHNIKINVGRGDLMQAVKLASVFARDSSNIVKFAVGKNSLKLLAESSQSGSQENSIDVKVEVEDKEVFGEKGEFVIAFNYKYLEDFVNSVEGDSVDILFTDPNSPGVFLDSGDKDYLHLIMPVRI